MMVGIDDNVDNDNDTLKVYVPSRSFEHLYIKAFPNMIDKQVTMMVIPPFGNQNLSSNDDDDDDNDDDDDDDDDSINNHTHSRLYDH